MSTITYGVLDSAGIRMDLMIENEVRALLFDGASIRNSGALLFAGDIAGMGSDTIAMRYASLDGYQAMADVSESLPQLLPMPQKISRQDVSASVMTLQIWQL